MEGKHRDYTRRQVLARSAAGLTAFAGASVLAACGSSSSSSSAGGTSSAAAGASSQSSLKGPVAGDGWAPTSFASNEMNAGTAEAARQLGIQCKIYDYNVEDSKELSNLSEMNAQGVVAVSTLILDNGITRQIADYCAKNNMYISTWAQMGQWIVPSEPSVQYHYQGLANPPEGAYFNCVNMFKKLGGRGNFVHISGAAGSATSKAKDHAVNQALAKFPGIKLVARQYGNYDRTTTDTVLTNILAKAGGKVDAVYCQSDDSGTGALDALRKQGLLGKVLVAGADGIPEFVQAIIDGNAFGTEGAVAFFGGGYTVVQGLDAAAGHKPDPAETLMVQDLLLIDNVASAKEYQATALVNGAAGKLFDYKKMSRVLHPNDWDPQWPLRTYDPQQFWAINQGVPKPPGYSLPANYVSAVANGGRAKMDKLYASQMKSFPLEAVARKSLTGKTVFEQLDAAGTTTI